MKLKYVIKALKYQLPISRLFRNFFITGNGWGMFSIHAHINKKGKPKVGYNTLETALKVANSMQKKYGFHYSSYMCPRCGKFHLGRNRDSINIGT